MNAGKRMEAQWRKDAMTVPDLYYQRMNDGTAAFGGNQEMVRFQKTNPYDCFMYLAPTLYLLELKSHKGSSLPFAAMRKNQVQELQRGANYPGVVAGFVVYMSDKEECYFLDARKVTPLYQAAQQGTGKKSLSLRWMQENGEPIGVTKKRTNPTFDVAAFVASHVEEAQWNES